MDESMLQRKENAGTIDKKGVKEKWYFQLLYYAQLVQIKIEKDKEFTGIKGKFCTLGSGV